MTATEKIRKSFSFSGEEFAAFFCPPEDRFCAPSPSAALLQRAQNKFKNAMEGKENFSFSPLVNYRAQSGGIALELDLTCHGAEKQGDSLCLWGLFFAPRDPLREAACRLACAVLCRKRNLHQITLKKALFDPLSGRLSFGEQVLSREELNAFLDAALLRAFRLLQAVCPQEGTLRFPYPSLREGQRELMEECYAALREKRSLMVCAPTGLGKTLSFLYPALKGVEKGRASRVLFLTPKGSTQRQIARAAQTLNSSPRVHRCIVLFARRSACVSGGRCLKENCPLSRGSGERLEGALTALFSRYDCLFPAHLRTVAEEFSLCPFFLSQMAARLCDVVVGDYNFVFDPKARLDTLADGKALLLVDEAHNLPDRVSQSLSFALTPELCQALRERFPQASPRAQEAFALLEQGFARRRKRLSLGGDAFSLRPPVKTAKACRLLFSALRPLWNGEDEEAGELLYALRGFASACQAFERGYVCSVGEDGSLTLCLADPSSHIRQSTEGFLSAVYFSATLLPQEYFFSALGGTQKDRFFEAASPFDPSRLLICKCPVNTTLSHRGESLRPLTKLFAAACKGQSRVLAFFPSFEYLQRAESALGAFLPGVTLLSQRPGMKDEERRAFLARMDQGDGEKTLLGLCVLGGLFAEGVELEHRGLDGVIVVGTGMAPPSPEKEAATLYYTENGRDGKAYSYALPGFHKVLQAAGRVIRKEEDRGFVILCDKRYADGSFDSLFPAHWNEGVVCATPGELSEALRRFRTEE